EPPRALIPNAIEIAIKVAPGGPLEPLQEAPHRADHVRVGIEGAAGETNVSRAILAKAPHQIFAAAEHADRKTAAERLAVSDQIGLDAEEFLRAAAREAEADEHLVEDQHDAPLRADRAQLLQPLRIGGLVEMRAARAVDER